MAKKILLGMAMVAMLCAIGAAGYRFGKALRERERALAAAVSAQASSARKASVSQSN